MNILKSSPTAFPRPLLTMNHKPKVGRPVGWRKPDTKEGKVSFRCQLEDKGRWVQAARRRGQKLAEWIIETLNRAAKNQK